MTGARLVLVAGAFALGAGGCSHDRTPAADSAAGDSTVAVIDTLPSAPPQPAAVQPDNHAAPATTPSTGAKSRPAHPATTSAKPNPPQSDTLMATTTPKPAPSDSTIILSKGTPAFVVFRDSIGQADLAWLESERLAVVSVNKAGHSASVRVPSDYAGNPRANPRVARFTIAMR